MFLYYRINLLLILCFHWFTLKVQCWLFFVYFLFIISEFAFCWVYSSTCRVDFSLFAFSVMNAHNFARQLIRSSRLGFCVIFLAARLISCSSLQQHLKTKQPLPRGEDSNNHFSKTKINSFKKAKLISICKTHKKSFPKWKYMSNEQA